MVICLVRGADDLHMIQLMPLPLYRLLLRYNPDWFSVSGAGLARLSWKEAINGCLCLLVSADDLNVDVDSIFCSLCSFMIFQFRMFRKTSIVYV